MNKINLAVIDGDSICYLHKETDSLQEAIEKVDNKIEEILVETKADYYVILLSKSSYFRHDISKTLDKPKGTYKSNRVYGRQPWVKTTKEYIISKYKGVYYPKLEADDICAWLMGIKLYSGQILGGNGYIDIITGPTIEHVRNVEEVNKILIAKDKDLLYSIPGKHLNFSKKLGSDTWGMEWVETSINDASFYEWKAMITGDQSDGIKGLYRKGKAWVDKNFAGKSLKEVQHLVFDEYMSEYGTEKGIYEFQKNYRLLHMLTTDEDMLREVGYIPQLPKFQEVNKPEEIKPVEIEF